MSVLKSKRGTSGVKFLDTARELQVFTLRACVKFPKKYTFYITQGIVASATKVYDYVKKGNSIYLSSTSSSQDFELRHEQFVLAKTELQCLSSRINLAYDTFPIADKKVDMWFQLISEESALLQSVIKSDQDRYKGLK